MHKQRLFSRRGAFVLLVTLFVGSLFSVDMLRLRQSVAAQLGLPEPVEMVLPLGTFNVPVLKGIRMESNDPYNVEFMVEAGDKAGLTEDDISILIEYFMAALTFPGDRFWVNFSPYESDRIIDNDMALTSAGRVLLEQDYILKQMCASLAHPATPAGKAYWQTARPGELSKYWITAQTPILARDPDTGFVYVKEASLAVKSENGSGNDMLTQSLNVAVNHDRRFGGVRQLYHSLILARWFKQTMRDAVYASYADTADIKGLESGDPAIKEKVYGLYLAAFKKGLCNTIMKTKDAVSGKVLHTRYFAGGVTLDFSVSSALKEEPIEYTVKKPYIANITFSRSSSSVEIPEISTPPMVHTPYIAPVDDESLSVKVARFSELVEESFATAFPGGIDSQDRIDSSWDESTIPVGRSRIMDVLGEFSAYLTRNGRYESSYKPSVRLKARRARPDLFFSSEGIISVSVAVPGVLHSAQAIRRLYDDKGPFAKTLGLRKEINGIFKISSEIQTELTSELAAENMVLLTFLFPINRKSDTDTLSLNGVPVTWQSGMTFAQLIETAHQASPETIPDPDTVLVVRVDQSSRFEQYNEYTTRRFFSAAVPDKPVTIVLSQPRSVIEVKRQPSVNTETALVARAEVIKVLDSFTVSDSKALEFAMKELVKKSGSYSAELLVSALVETRDTDEVVRLRRAISLTGKDALVPLIRALETEMAEHWSYDHGFGGRVPRPVAVHLFQMLVELRDERAVPTLVRAVLSFGWTESSEYSSGRQLTIYGPWEHNYDKKFGETLIWDAFPRTDVFLALMYHDLNRYISDGILMRADMIRYPKLKELPDDLIDSIVNLLISLQPVSNAQYINRREYSFQQYATRRLADVLFTGGERARARLKTFFLNDAVAETFDWLYQRNVGDGETYLTDEERIEAAVNAVKRFRGKDLNYKLKSILDDNAPDQFDLDRYDVEDVATKKKASFIVEYVVDWLSKEIAAGNTRLHDDIRSLAAAYCDKRFIGFYEQELKTIADAAGQESGYISGFAELAHALIRTKGPSAFVFLAGMYDALNVSNPKAAVFVRNVLAKLYVHEHISDRRALEQGLNELEFVTLKRVIVGAFDDASDVYRDERLLRNLIKTFALNDKVGLLSQMFEQCVASDKKLDTMVQIVDALAPLSGSDRSTLFDRIVDYLDKSEEIIEDRNHWGDKNVLRGFSRLQSADNFELLRGVFARARSGWMICLSSEQLIKYGAQAYGATLERQPDVSIVAVSSRAIRALIGTNKKLRDAIVQRVFQEMAQRQMISDLKPMIERVTFRPLDWGRGKTDAFSNDATALLVDVVAAEIGVNPIDLYDHPDVVEEFGRSAGTEFEKIVKMKVLFDMKDILEKNITMRSSVKHLLMLKDRVFYEPIEVILDEILGDYVKTGCLSEDSNELGNYVSKPILLEYIGDFEKAAQIIVNALKDKALREDSAKNDNADSSSGLLNGGIDLSFDLPAGAVTPVKLSSDTGDTTLEFTVKSISRYTIN